MGPKQFEDWINIAKKIRARKTQVLNIIDVLHSKGHLTKEDTNFIVTASLALMDAPLVQYIIPQILQDHLWDSPIDINAPLLSFIGLPFNPIALAREEDPSAFTLFYITPDNRLVCIDGDGAYNLDMGKTPNELSNGDGHGKRMHFALSLLLYISGGDSSYREVSPVVSGKRARNKQPLTVIRGEVGGRFVSALKKWEKDRNTEHQNRPHGSPRPHLRAGHFHLYWTGKGRTIPKVQFLHPCLVNADSVGDVEIQRTVKP